MRERERVGIFPILEPCRPPAQSSVSLEAEADQCCVCVLSELFLSGIFPLSVLVFLPYILFLVGVARKIFVDILTQTAIDLHDIKGSLRHCCVLLE